MSRVGKSPVILPEKVEVTIGTDQISVKGPLGTLSQAITPNVKIEKIENRLEIKLNENSRQANAISGTLRALIANMVQGVSKLTLVGVGYRAQAQGDKLNLTLGFSHPVVHQLPAGVKVETPTQTEIIIKGADKQKVGQVAADVRNYRPPEPYKGKGVRYADEQIVLKETKKK
jgi:large subunit ribosomal protein L6